MIFEEQIARKPDHYPWAQDFITAMWNGHWTSNEFNFNSDLADFKVNLNDEEREIVKKALSAIGQIEIAVKKFWANLGNTLPHPSLTDLGYVMASIEVIHNDAYEKLLSVLGLETVFEENLKLPVIKNRVNYLKKYQSKVYKSDKKQYIYALILFTLFIENVSLFSQFYIISWFNRYKNVLKDTSQQINYTRQEENIHAQAGIKIIQQIREEYPELFDEELEARIVEEAKAAYEAENKIIEWIMGDYAGYNISKEILGEYIKKRINESLNQIGYEDVFELDEELIAETRWSDEELYGNSLTDFFYRKPVEYAKSTGGFDVDDLF